MYPTRDKIKTLSLMEKNRLFTIAFSPNEL